MKHMTVVIITHYHTTNIVKLVTGSNGGNLPQESNRQSWDKQQAIVVVNK
jgi:hypothetical protein